MSKSKMSYEERRKIPPQLVRIEFFHQEKSLETIANNYDIHVADVEAALREEIQMLLEYCRTH